MLKTKPPIDAIEKLVDFWLDVAPEHYSRDKEEISAAYDRLIFRNAFTVMRWLYDDDGEKVMTKLWEHFDDEIVEDFIAEEEPT